MERAQSQKNTSPKAFIDSNVLIYLLSADPGKADQAETVMQKGALISTQVLNEVANVARRKLAMSWEGINPVDKGIQCAKDGPYRAPFGLISNY